MGMCKNCGDVFGSTEMKDGLCKTCFIPENIDKIEKENSLKQKEKRPIGVTVVGFLVGIGSILLLIVGIWTLSQGRMEKEMIFLIIVSLVQLYVSFGILNGKSIARVIYTVLTVINIVIPLVLASNRVLLGKDILQMSISIIFVGLLFIPSSNKFFEKNTHNDEKNKRIK